MLIVEPLKLLFEFICFYAYKLTHNAGLSILAMSLVVNFLLLPLYFRADKLEKEQLQKKKMMKPWVDRIKSAFSGDERVMMLQAYYRENNYKSTDVLKESISLFLQIPFFIAAYSFLSNLNILHGSSLGPIKDLGLPDGLIPLGSVSINLLPILMTAINIISGFVYSDKKTIKDNLKLIIIALVFLVLLYGSPAGLVFYWTLNNIFSLMKNVVVSLWHPTARKEKKKHPAGEMSFSIIMLSCAVLAVLTGFFIPSDVIAANPTEMINTYIENPYSPAWYLLSSTLAAAGTFLIWIPLFIYLTKETLGKVMTYVMPVIATAGIANYVFFNKSFGTISRKLIFDLVLYFLNEEWIPNIVWNVVIAGAVLVLVWKFKKFFKPVLVIFLITICFVSFKNLRTIVKDINEHGQIRTNSAEDVVVPMSTTGQNVVVIMMDRMIGAYIPYIFNERPDVASQFDGFTYYPNTVSFGRRTNMAVPAVFGGYEYTPYMLNLRADEPLVDKHNESLRVLPTIFADEGWTVSVGDPSLANYAWYDDVSIYDDNENINAFQMAGTFNYRSEFLTDAGEELELRLNRNLFCYGIMKIMPNIIQSRFYTDGSYTCMNLTYGGYVDDTFIGLGELHRQYGILEDYVSQYMVLEALPDIVDVTSEPENTFFMFANESTHEVCMLEEPSYQPAVVIDNTEFDEAHQDRFTVDGVQMIMDTDYHNYLHYQCDMAACIALGRWFDYLRANGLYDNTRIIIVADHGFPLSQFDDLLISDPEYDAESLNPILMVKDFGSTEFVTSDQFMTNADTPYLALDGIIDNPVNPFTGNPMIPDDKTGDQIIYISEELSLATNGETQFNDPDSYWMTVRNNIYDDENWNIYTG
ncbi:MAG: YidC/Oxa1 family membrane protein insertase [Saccharofermentans sp.]|nr:YidC/Oxa1 family membrane protein insertase [Saccharofermentans sp.]